MATENKEATTVETIAFGAVCAAASAVCGLLYMNEIKHPKKPEDFACTPGRVLSFHETWDEKSKSFHSVAVIEYTARDEIPRTFRTTSKYYQGERVEVIYEVANPEKARIAGGMDNTTALLGATVALGGFALLFFIAALTKKVK